jgi:hypothetical protein
VTGPVPPGGPLRLTTGRWFNDFSEARQGPGGEWIIKPPKILAHRGSYDQFRYGHDHPSTWGLSHFQRCLLCCPGSMAIGIDVDYPELFATTRTARFIGRAQAISTVGERYHVLLDFRGLPLIVWPRQTPIRGADVKSRGFIPVPGCVHYTGQLYQPVPGAMAVPWTHELHGAIIDDQRDEQARCQAELDRYWAGVNEVRAGQGLPPLTGGTGGHGGCHDDQLSAATMGMIVKRLRAGWQAGPELKEDVYAEWCEIAIPRDPSRPWERRHFDRHYGDERQGGLAEALKVLADEAAWMPGLMAWAEAATAEPAARRPRQPGQRKRRQPGRAS